MAISLKRNALLSRLKPIFTLQRLCHSLVEGKPQARHVSDKDYDSTFEPGDISISKWKKMDSRSLGITRGMIPQASIIVIRTLQSQGFKAYLVGGCVRDLLLKRTPKDFDVITTAGLKQIRKQFHRFHRCQIVGRRFPICRVDVRGSVIEVSSFETLAQHAEGKEKILVSKMPRGCDKLDFLRWRNSMHRDFTINSLFFDPLVHKIYDYTNAMDDLSELKLRTLVPAHLSFTEDCARILRGLRIAARLGLSLSKEIEIAICKLASSILNLAKSRIMMELNYMLSYGAAEPSLCLLQRFYLLEILLPFHAAYLSQQATRAGGQSSIMLMKLFFNLDQLVTCDRPSDDRLWVGLLAFHLALVNNPQHPLVVLTFASILYHAKWKEGVIYARQHARAAVNFVPEILEPCDFKSDDELAEKVIQLALLVQDSLDVLTQTDSLLNMMEKFPGFPCSGLVFVSKNMACHVAQLFEVLAHDIRSYTDGRRSFEINYNLLGMGDVFETRFALGKIIMETMGCGVGQVGEIDNENLKIRVMDKDVNRKHPLSPSNSISEQVSAKKQRLIAKNDNLLEHKKTKKQSATLESKLEVIADRFLIEQEESQEGAKKYNEAISNAYDGVIKKEEVAVSQSPMQELIGMLETVMENSKCTLQQQEVLEKKQEVVEKNTKPENDKCHSDSPKKETKNTEKRKKQMVEEKGRNLPLSALFK